MTVTENLELELRNVEVREMKNLKLSSSSKLGELNMEQTQRITHIQELNPEYIRTWAEAFTKAELMSLGDILENVQNKTGYRIALSDWEKRVYAKLGKRPLNFEKFENPKNALDIFEVYARAINYDLQEHEITHGIQRRAWLSGESTEVLNKITPTTILLPPSTERRLQDAFAEQGQILRRHVNATVQEGKRRLEPINTRLKWARTTALENLNRV